MENIYPRPLESPAFANLRVRFARFYRKLTILTDKRIRDKLVYQVATAILNSEEIRQIPVNFRHTFEGAVWEARKMALLFERGARAKHRRRALAAFSSKGGSAERADPLKELIQNLVRENPVISEHQLRAALRKMEGDGVIDCVNNQTVRYFRDGVMKELSGPALMNRLYRAKQKWKKHSR
jgi:hypothetical protein